ncbi:MAG TPA: ubiquinone/menaquinone biosynthesis methyltransferase [Syntrophales bacterium]|nr:ubiquinone/menaquinone biosynthesis methyltransferase [Syntrophales bacterium]
MDKRPSVIGRMFDRIAPTYDVVNTVLSLSLDMLWRKKAVDALAITDGDIVLDVATGTGKMAVPAARGGGKVVGIDLSRQMLLHASSRAGTQGFTGLYSVVQGDALLMPFRDNTFGRAMVAFGIRNMNNLNIFLTEINRVLNTGGRFSVLEFSLPECLFFRLMYTVYLKYVVPMVGGLLSGDYDTYKYLRDSIAGFPVPGVLEDMMKRHGFRIVRSSAIMGGISHLYLLQKE